MASMEEALAEFATDLEPQIKAWGESIRARLQEIGPPNKQDKGWYSSAITKDKSNFTGAIFGRYYINGQQVDEGTFKARQQQGGQGQQPAAQPQAGTGQRQAAQQQPQQPRQKRVLELSGRQQVINLMRGAAKLTAPIRQKASQFVAARYKNLSDRYGPKGAAAILAASVALLPVPVPGTSLVPIALAEAIVRLRRGMKGKGYQNDLDACLDALLVVKSSGWVEAEHPRDHGKFAENPGERGESKSVEPKQKKPQIGIGGTPANDRLPDHARPNLDDSEIQEVQSYLSEDTEYFDVNEHLRGGGAMYDTTLQDAINKADVMDEPVTVFRGMQVDDIDEFLSEIADGEYSDKGFMSTSTHASFRGNVQMKIRARHGLDASFYGHNRNEFLLPAGSEFTVLSVNRTKKGIDLELEQKV